ncbi:MAG TPA: hypothetical protein DDW52_05165 [Planctomycetaceae bacterium]|nr:hypothetical protein [Planctomycetaceae bacterium]
MLSRFLASKASIALDWRAILAQLLVAAIGVSGVSAQDTSRQYTTSRVSVGVGVSSEATLAGVGSNLPKLPAGTQVEPQEDSDQEFNKVILLARPKIESGNVDALPDAIRNAVSSMVLSILAHVERDSSGKFRLVSVGAGFATPVEGELTVVTPDTAGDLGAKLGFVQRQLLGQNSKQLDTLPIVARSKQVLVFDAPSIMLTDGKHEKFRMRHFIWADSSTGRTATFVWLLPERSDAAGQQAGKLRWLPPGLKERREIHVDGREFSILGIPTDRAFALEDLPPGRDLDWTDEGRRLATKSSYGANDLKALVAAINASLAKTKQDR